MTDEARRQQQVLAAVRSGDPTALGLREQGERARRGLAAYRANAAATAERALAAIYPTVQAMVGTDTFRAMAAGHWRDEAPLRGDLGEWGDAFPAWVERQPSLAEWPWLADSARLEWAAHICERAADGELDAASIQALAQADPATVRLVLTPGAALVDSVHPVVAIHAAHRAQDFGAAREALQAGRGERAFVVRQGWRATVHALDEPAAAWTRALLEGRSLADALAQAGAGFDFAGWLAQALRAGWLKGSAPMADTPG